MTTPPVTIDTNGSQISYGVETVWGTVPATTFNAIRYNSETLSMTKTRTRPAEINSNREVIQAVTTAVQAGGAIAFSLSWGTFDDFIAAAINTSWTAVVSIAGVAGDIALTNTSATSATLISTTANKFTNITQGSWIRLLGFTNTANNNLYYVATKVSALSLVLTTPFAATVTETPTGTLAQVRQRNIRNGTAFTSLYLQQKYSSSLWLRYAGCYVTGFSISGGVGQYLQGSITMLAASEVNASTTADTGGIVAAPTGSVFNPVGAFGGCFFNETSVGIVDSFTLNIASPGAALEYGMGSATAAGLMQGNLEVTGNVKMYFQNYTLYTQFLAETSGRLSIVAKDVSGQAYVFQVLNCFLNNPKIDAGGVNQPVFVTLDIEGNPSAATGITTISVDELPIS